MLDTSHQAAVAEPMAEMAAPFDVLNADGSAPIVLACDHASPLIPARYGTLGLSAAQTGDHIAWDIGIARVARTLSGLLDAPTIFGGVSRLVIDLNRRPATPPLIPEQSDGVAIPGNCGLSAAARQERIESWFRPYHDRAAGLVQRARQRHRRPALISLHSFTPTMDGFARPWEIGFLWTEKSAMAQPLIADVKARTNLHVGDNQPYKGDPRFGYTVHVHGEDNGIPSLGIEIRQDLLRSDAAGDRWADLLATTLSHLIAEPGIIEKG